MCILYVISIIASNGTLLVASLLLRVSFLPPEDEILFPAAPRALFCDDVTLLSEGQSSLIVWG